MRTHVKCGKMFTGAGDSAATDQAIVIEDGRIDHAGPADAAPPTEAADEVLDHSGSFVLPGLIDVHVHLSYGNAKTEEDIDFFAPVEYRALCALHAAQRVLNAGFTSIADPTTTSVVTHSVRDAIRSGMFTGPRIRTAGRRPEGGLRPGFADMSDNDLSPPFTYLMLRTGG